MTDKELLLGMYVFFGLLLVVLSVPLMREKIRPNWFYGFRVQKAFDSPEIWYAINKFSAKRLLWAGVSLVVASIGLYFLPQLSLDVYALGCLAAFGVVFVVGLVQSFRYLRSL